MTLYKTDELQNVQIGNIDAHTFNAGIQCISMKLAIINKSTKGKHIAFIVL